MDAQARMAYERYMPRESIMPLVGAGELRALRQAIDAYTEQSLQDFIIGRLDPLDDGAWEAHLGRYEALNLDALLAGWADRMKESPWARR
jgi:hypothetical protein